MLPRTGRPPLFHWALVVVTGALGPVNQAGKPLRRSTFQGQTRVIAPKFFMQASFTAVNPPTFPAARGRAVGQCPIIYWVPSRVWSGAGLWGVCQGPALDCGMKRPPSRATSVFLPAPRAPVHRAHCGGKGGGSRPAGKPPRDKVASDSPRLRGFYPTPKRWNAYPTGPAASFWQDSFSHRARGAGASRCRTKEPPARGPRRGDPHPAPRLALGEMCRPGGEGGGGAGEEGRGRGEDGGRRGPAHPPGGGRGAAPPGGGACRARLPAFPRTRCL